MGAKAALGAREIDPSLTGVLRHVWSGTIMPVTYQEAQGSRPCIRPGC